MNFQTFKWYLRMNFDAKTRWKMANDRNPMLPKYQDKLWSKNFMSENGFKVPQTLHSGDNARDILLGRLHGLYMIKTNHGCKHNILLYNGHFFLYAHPGKFFNDTGQLLPIHEISEMAISKSEFIEVINGWLSKPYAPSREWAYKSISPRVYVEPFVTTTENHVANVYRFLMFHGKVKAIEIRIAQKTRMPERLIFDTNRQLKFGDIYQIINPNITQLPSETDEYISNLNKLEIKTDFVRVDTIYAKNEFVFNEFTLYQGGGYGHPSYERQSRWLGSFWPFTLNQKIQAYYESTKLISYLLVKELEKKRK